MYEEDFVARLTQLRLEHNVSARDMSLSLGQNPGYINNIESGKALPSMTVFLYICDYFKITPEEFFEKDNPNPQKNIILVENLKRLDNESFSHIAAIVNKLVKNNSRSYMCSLHISPGAFFIKLLYVYSSMEK